MPSGGGRKNPSAQPERREHRESAKDTTAALAYDELLDNPYPKHPDPASDQQRPKSPAWITGSSLAAFPVDNEADSGNSSLLTVDTIVQNTSLPHKKKTTTVFLDTGSQKNFCTTKLALQLGLRKTGSRRFRLNTLACKAPQEMTLNRYLLDLPLKDSTKLTIVVYALPHLVGKITVVQARPIGEQRPDGHRWMTRVNDVEPQVLIGNHVYWQLRLAEIDFMKDGTRIIDSSLGTLATRELGDDELQSCPVINVCPFLTPAASESLSHPPDLTGASHRESDLVQKTSVTQPGVPCDYRPPAWPSHLTAPDSGAALRATHLSPALELPYLPTNWGVQLRCSMPRGREVTHSIASQSRALDKHRVLIDMSRFDNLDHAQRAAIVVHRAAAKFLYYIGKHSAQPRWTELRQTVAEVASDDEIALARQFLIRQDQLAFPPTQEEVAEYKLRTNASGIFVAPMHPEVRLSIGFRLFLAREGHMRELLLQAFSCQYGPLVAQVIHRFDQVFLSPSRRSPECSTQGLTSSDDDMNDLSLTTVTLVCYSAEYAQQLGGRPHSQNADVLLAQNDATEAPLLKRPRLADQCFDPTGLRPGELEQEAAEDAGSIGMPSDEPPASSRYQLRPRKSVNYVSGAFLLVLLIQLGATSVLPSFAGMKPKPSSHPGRICNTSNPTFAVSSERCVNTGLVLYRDKVTSRLCFEELSCPLGQHVIQRGSKTECAPACRCEEWWSFGCSHYHGKATAQSQIGNRDARRVLQELAPSICSLKPTAKCTVPEPARLYQVALFDNSTHYVKNLNLVHEDFSEDDIQCVGEGRLVSGSPKFCEMHHCYDNATRLCYHPYAERVYLQGNTGEVLVKSWGAVETVVYVEEHVQHPRSNTTFQIACLPYGFLVTAGHSRVRYELCSGGLCVGKGKPRAKEEITFPAEYLLKAHLVMLTVWEKGQEVAREEIECPGRAICEQMQCGWCRALIRNPQCVNPATVAGIIILLYIAVFALFLVCLKRASLKRLTTTETEANQDNDIHESTAGMELPTINRQASEVRPLMRLPPSTTPPPPPSRIAPAPPLPPRTSEAATSEDATHANEEATEAESYEPFLVRRAPAADDVRGTDEEYAYAQQCPELAQVVYDNARLTRLGRFRRTPKADTFLTTSTLGLVACLAILATQAHGCSKTHDVIASTQMCYIQKSGHTACYYDQVITLTVGDTDRHICITLRDPQTRPIGTAIVDVSGVELVCLRKPIYHTRQFVINVASSKRCYRAGSCYSNMCELTTSSSLVPELSAANQKPGITYCRNAAGCSGNGCWYCVDACLYFRAYATPTNSRVGEVFECQWRPRLRISVALQELGQEIKQRAFEAVEAQTVTQGDVSLTVSSISLPPMPSADQRYVKDGKRVAVVDRDHRRILECDSERDAANLTASCRLLVNPCSCGPAGNVAVCDCPRHESVMDSLDEEDSVLPRHLGGIWLTNNGSTLLAEADYTGAQIDLSLHNLRMEVKVDNNSCEIAPLHAAGCRQCNHGVTLDYVCKTDFGSALAAVRCATTEFHAHCNRFGQPNRHHFRTDKHILHEQCTVTCPQGTSSFLLEATLATLDSGNSTLRHAAGIENLAEFHWSDVTGFLGDAALFVWRSILLFDLKVWLVTAAVVILASIAMLGGFRYIERNHPDLLRLVLFAVVLPLACASQRSPTPPTASDHAVLIPRGKPIALGQPAQLTQLTPSFSAMSYNVIDYAGLELVDELDDRQAGPNLLEDDLDEDILDYDEGNQAVLHDDDSLETDNTAAAPTRPSNEAGNGASQRREAGAELRPPLMLASRIVVPPESQPAPPPTLSSVVVCDMYKQVNDSTKSSFEPNSVCHRDEPGHEKCGHIQLRDLEPEASRDLRYLYVRTPLQYAFVLHAKRGVYGSRKNAFLRQLLMEDPKRAVDVYERFRTERATVKDTARSTDMWQSYTERFKSCRPANRFLKTDTTKAIWFRTRLGDQIENADEQNRFRSMLATSYESLQKIRLKYCHPGKTLLNCNLTIVGDDLALDMHAHMKIGGHHVNVPNATMAEAALSKFVFGSACKLVLILIGQTDLRDGRRPSEIIKSCHEVAEYLKQFAHLTVAWLPLPYLHVQRNGWHTLAQMMPSMVSRYQKHTYYGKSEGREVTEIFREGNSFCPETVYQYGKPTQLGWRLYIRFLKGVANLHIPGPLVRTEQSVPGTNPVDHRSEESDAGPSGSKGSHRSAADLLKVAEDALQAARNARAAAEDAFRSPAMKRARASSPDEDVIYVGTEHRRIVNH